MNAYRERVSYQESVENEQRKNLEQQVDVILKMEEERLVLLKEHQDSSQRLEGEKETGVETEAKLRQTLAQVETHVADLKDHIRTVE